MNPLQLVELLRGHKNYIQTHNYPDPDAVASAFGLQYFLRQHGVDAVICYDGTVDKLSTKKMAAQLWKNGSQHFTPLRQDGEYKELAEYLVKEKGKEGQKCRYTRSREPYCAGAKKGKGIWKEIG